MTARTEVERRPSPGLLGWLERELSAFPGLHGADADRIMRCEEYVDEGRLVVRAELPGVDPDKDVTVSVHDGVLRIRAHRREEHHDRRRTEFFYGEMIRTIALPPGADASAISATYKDGILEVVVPVPPTPTGSATTIPVIRNT